MFDNKVLSMAATAISKCESGEPITNAELFAGIMVLHSVLPFIDMLGPKFNLMSKALRHKLIMLEDFKVARKMYRDQKRQGKI